MKRSSLIVAFLFGFMCSQHLCAQSTTKKYSPKQLNEDYTKFCTILEKVHTGLYDYISKEEWAQMKDSIKSRLTHPISEREFSRLLCYQVGRIRNTHTRVGVTDTWINTKTNTFPFIVQYIHDNLYVRESLLNSHVLPKGTEILLINGKTPIQIREIIWPYISTDGYIKTYKRATLSEFFSWFYALFVEEPKEFIIKYRLPDGTTSNITLPSFRASFRKITNDWKKSHRDEVTPLKLELDKKLQTAYFRIHHSEAIMDSLPVFFNRMRKDNITTLILDLRGMWGLTDELHAATLYSYLVTQPFRFYERMEVMSNDHSLFDKDFSYKPYARSLEEIKHEYLDKLTDSGNGYFTWQHEPYLGVVNPADINFNGTVYILTDGLNYSASTDFTSKASTLHNVFVVGEETGGEYRSYVSGAMFGLVLPHSKIGVKVSTWKSILSVEENPKYRGRGVLPDFEVVQSLPDFIKDRDTVKEYVYDLIKKTHTVSN